ncbi:ABC transporter ATP-binding protein [Marinilactibacillus psychrotolerans]|uniref:ABC transporter ATP-binding protein n=2 Tax=Marinilactibacillus psychrotolerans TaxID=191770 RepID=A0A5R9C347_9LACT|nr:ABC transporter ATP-binding protein [Marinilactibacillus psychrotolerans]TLQ07194.1 ABC transporter ATP-binding protein [Marinilactibacillus psychrotolerans]GEQ33981.1 multidrug ABC transporter ATP-binding and permease protein [Marinilactibacillus psychrotolerans]GEQ36444.1 multidrug ABC transporter ATP-binding and permease protein [Marinilactibacillus psychrotolerans]SJN26014.1 Lipid A export ATP-binding/permease protein MsbA [Marinilactibacillus psychrotolerans 42ea]
MTRLAKFMNPWRVFLTVLFMAVQVAGMLAMPTLTANIIDFGVAEGNIDYIIRTGFYMLGFTLLTILSALLNVYFAAKESQGLGNTLRKKIYRMVIFFTNDELDKYGTSTLITRSTNDIMQIQFVMMMVLRIMTLSPLLIIGAGTMAYTREPQLAFVFIITIPVLAALIWFILHFSSPLFKSMQKKTDRLNRVFREGLTGIRVIRAFNKDEYERERFDEANWDFAQTSIKANTVMAFMMPSMVLAVSVTNILIIWFGSQLVSTGDMQVGNMVAFMTYAMQILIGVMNVSMVLFFLPRGQVSAERVLEVLDTQNTIKDPEQAKHLKDTTNISLRFDNVSFRYHGAEKSALENIDFTLNKGERLAIIGGTGSGKTTLANLIPRLYDVERGQIKVNGVDVRDVEQGELRRLIGFAPQKALLFSGTIRENMKYGKPDATDEEIWHALDVAQGKDFVSGLPKGLDARVEHGGGNFSGGQRQRLSIARALVTKADILVFDDSFSALDFKTDARLREALKPDTQNAAVVIIAQRISTVIDADQIIVLDQGTIVGQGTHEELKANNPIYQEIMESQLKGEDI